MLKTTYLIYCINEQRKIMGTPYLDTINKISLYYFLFSIIVIVILKKYI